MRRATLTIVTLLSITLLIGAISCSKQTPTEPDPPDHQIYRDLLSGVQLTPSSGPPGTIVTLIGLDSLPADSGFSLSIGGQPAPLIVSSGQPVQTAIPINLDTAVSSWPITPVGLQTLTLHFDDQPVDSIEGAIQVDSLAPAPGAMDSVLVKLSRGATALKQIAVSLNADDTLLMATCDAMDELLYTGEYSLTALINGTSPIEGYNANSSKLFASLMVNAGMLDIITRWSDTLVIAGTIASRISNNESEQSTISDEALASRMQLHDFLESFGTTVIGQTALKWQMVSAVAGGIAIVRPAVGVYEFIVGWTIGVLDFVINKLAYATLPSDVTEIDLDFYSHNVKIGDTTEAIVWMSAKNNPPNITPIDIMNQVLGGMQLTQWINNRLGPVAARTLRTVILDIVNWVLGVIKNYLSTNYNSATSLDVALPTKTWSQVWVNNPALIDLMIPDLSKVGYMTDSYNGLAKNSLGPIDLQMRTQPAGPNTWINPLMQAAGYAGGAFGDDLSMSNTETINIVSELALEVSFSRTIAVGGSNVLGINAGYFDSNGDPYWVPGIDISLFVTDGYADVTTGVTDAQGHFSSMITMDSIADSVTVKVYANGAFNSFGDTVVVANKEGDLNIDTRLNYSDWNCAYVRPGEIIPFDVTVYNSDSGTVANAQVDAWVVGGGSLGSTTGQTNSLGEWSTDFIAPQSMPVPVEIHVEVTPRFGQSKVVVVPINRLTMSSSSGPVFVWGELPDTNATITGELYCGITVVGGPDDDGSSSPVKIGNTCDTGLAIFSSQSLATSTGFRYGAGGISTSFDITESSSTDHTLAWRIQGAGAASGDYAEISLHGRLEGAILYSKPSGLAFPPGAVLRATLIWSGSGRHYWLGMGAKVNGERQTGQSVFNIALPEGETALLIPVSMGGDESSTMAGWAIDAAVTVQMECLNCGD